MGVTTNSNATPLTISALTKYLKAKFDVDPYLRRVTVIGEVTNYRHRPHGHQYFSLKDEGARMNAVVFNNVFQRLPFKLEEGMKVLVTGQVSLYEPSGQYQINIQRIEPDGIGALYQALAQLKARFQKEGLFDQPKALIPKFPERIAVVTSPTGAVIRDILTTIERRYPIVEVTVFPTRVQGEGAAKEIVAAFEQIQLHADQFDTVIVARGGGSIEDLWSFNEEAVAHAILNCSIPVISSVGHEVDVTIADLVADLRAPTPTAAAELAVPVLVEVLAKITHLTERLMLSMQHHIEQFKQRLQRSQTSYVLIQPERLYQSYSQQVDVLTGQLNHHYHHLFEKYHTQLQYLKKRLEYQTPLRLIEEKQATLQQLDRRLTASIQQFIDQQRQIFKGYVSLLDAYSPLSVLHRGYTIVSQEDTIIKQVKQLDSAKPLVIQFEDGSVEANIIEINDQQL